MCMKSICWPREVKMLLIIVDVHSECTDLYITLFGTSTQKLCQRLSGLTCTRRGRTIASTTEVDATNIEREILRGEEESNHSFEESQHKHVIKLTSIFE